MADKKSNVYPVIIAGGSGSRLWPLSRELTPKQLIALVGEETLLQQTIDRSYLISKNTPLVVTNSRIHGQVDKTKLKEKVEFLLEPEPKNTAPAIALAVKWVNKKNPDGIVVILSADHHIDNKRFLPFMEEAVVSASTTEKIVLMGIKPSRPETGYGYIKMGGKINNSTYEIDRFAEKPEKKVAEEYLSSGNYLWNAGIFIAKAKVLKTEIESKLPDVAKVFNDDDIEKVFSNIVPVSIDQGLLEKTKNIAVVKTDADWNDLGSWGSVYDVSELDHDRNHIEGNATTENTSGCLLLERGNRRIATVGLKDIVVIDTEDVTLICDRNQTQDVKKIVEKVKAEPNNKECIEHKTMHRPWGRYTILDEGDGFKVKFIHVNPGGKLSLQSHSHRSEHWVVVKGAARITIGEELKDLKPNESIYVPVETKHRLENIGKTELTIVEVATGDYIEEDDIKRYDDIYARA